MPTQLPSGRWRTRVRHPRTGKQLSARAVIGGPDTYATCEAAAEAENEARQLLRSNARAGVTVRRVLAGVDDRPALASPCRARRTFTIASGRASSSTRTATCPFGRSVTSTSPPGSRAAATSAPSRRCGRSSTTPPAPRPARLVDRNPFAKLGCAQSRGRRDTQPPGQAEIARFVAARRRADAAVVRRLPDIGRPRGDASRRARRARAGSRSTSRPGRSSSTSSGTRRTRAFTPPKHGFVRTIALTDPARERLLALPRESEFVFTTLRGSHYRPSSRSHHWNRVRCAAGLGNVDLYTATRHYFGWYAWNVLELRRARHRACTSATRTAASSSASCTGTRTRGSPASVSARRSGRRRRRRYPSLRLRAEEDAGEEAVV